MRIIDIHPLKGPNYWSLHHKLINLRLDIGEYENKPTNEMNGFLDRIKQQLPSLYEHHCSEGIPGGFFERVKRGTWMGHVVEHIALEIQTLAGMKCNYGKTRNTNEKEFTASCLPTPKKGQEFMPPMLP